MLAVLAYLSHFYPDIIEKVLAYLLDPKVPPHLNLIFPIIFPNPVVMIVKIVETVKTLM